MQNRYVGFDLFRFIGAFIVVASHILIGIQLQPLTTPIQFILSPQITTVLVVSVIPVFICISGFLLLKRDVEEDEVKKTLKRASRFILLYVVWYSIFTLINWILNDGSFTGGSTGYVIDYFTGLFNPNLAAVSAYSLLGKGVYPVVTGILWYLYVYIGLILVSPLFKRLIKVENIKIARFGVLVIFIGGIVFPYFRWFFLSYFPENTLLNPILAQASLFEINRTGSIFLFWMLFGGLLSVDKRLQAFAKSIPYWVYAVALVVSSYVNTFIITTEMNVILANPPHVIGVSSSLVAPYESPLAVMQVITLFFLFYRLSFSINEKGTIGKFVSKESGTTLGIYIVHTLFILLLFEIVSFTDFSSLLINLFNDYGVIVQLLVYMLISLAVTIVSYISVKLMSKIPVVKGLI